MVAVGHFLNVSNLEPINKAIYSFHIPLFFFLSGFTYRKKYKRSWNDIAKRAKQLLLPYAIYIILSILFCNVYGDYELTWDRICYYNASIFFDEPIWFLIVMFAVFLIEYSVQTIKLKPIFQMALFVLLLAIGYICYKYKYGFASCLNHFGLNRIVLCFSFFLLGELFALIGDWRELQYKKIEYILLTLTSVLWLVSSLKNVKCSMYIFYFGNYWFFILSAIAGSVAIVLACKEWFDFQLLRKLSKYGIILMGTQYFWLIPIRDYLVSKEINDTFLYDCLCFVIPCVGISVTILLFDLIKKRIPIIKILNGEVL